MILDDEQLLTEILERREGGRFTNIPGDAGGPTKWGITLPILKEARGGFATVDDLAALTEDQAREVYRALFIVQPGFSQIADVQLRGLLIDSGVLNGRGEAVMFLQRAAGVPADGKLGPQTLAKVQAMDPRQLFDRVLAERIQYEGECVTERPVNAKFAAGWNRRSADILRAREWGTA